MLIRIVKMTFQTDKTDDFLQIFNESKHLIRHFEGCTHLELLQDFSQKNIFYTYSYWEAPLFLEKYRQSTLFEEVWSKTKKLFADKPQAFSVNRVMEVE